MAGTENVDALACYRAAGKIGIDAGQNAWRGVVFRGYWVRMETKGKSALDRHQDVIVQRWRTMLPLRSGL
jgi:hypothetical protein